MNHFSISLWCAMKSRFYMTTSKNQLSDWTEMKLQSTSQSQTCTKRRSWSLSGGLLPIWSTIAFWIPVKPVHLRSMLSKLMRCTKTAKPAASTGQQKGSNSSPRQCLTAQCTTNAVKLEWTGLRSFVTSTIFTWPVINWRPLLQASQQRLGRRTLRKSLSNPEA